MSTRSGTATALMVIDVQEAVTADAWDRDRIVGNVALDALAVLPRVAQRGGSGGGPALLKRDARLPRPFG